MKKYPEILTKPILDRIWWLPVTIQPPPLSLREMTRVCVKNVKKTLRDRKMYFLAAVKEKLMLLYKKRLPSQIAATAIWAILYFSENGVVIYRLNLIDGRAGCKISIIEWLLSNTRVLQISKQHFFIFTFWIQSINA